MSLATRRTYPDAAVEVTPLPGQDLKALRGRALQPWHAHPLDGSPSWSARFRRGAGVEEPGVARCTIQLQPLFRHATPLTRGQAFELRHEGQAIARGRITRCWHGCADGSGIHALTTEAAFRMEALPMLLEVFKPDERPGSLSLNWNLDRPFQPGVAVRSLFPGIIGLFEERELRAIANAAHAIGDPELFFWEQEAGIADEWLERNPCCRFPLRNEDDVESFVAYYQASVSAIGTAIFSATGQWGAVSYGGANYAVVGGQRRISPHLPPCWTRRQNRKGSRFCSGAMRATNGCGTTPRASTHPRAPGCLI